MLAIGSFCLAGCGLIGPENASGDAAARTRSSEGAQSEGSAAGEANDAGVALVLDGRSITFGDLNEYMQDQFLEELLSQPAGQIYELREKAAREMVQRHVIDSAAAERGLSPEALFQQVTADVPEPTVEDVADWYSQNQSRVRGAALEDVAPQIRDMLATERKARAWGDFVHPKVDALDWQLVMEPPRMQLAATRLVRGEADAPVTIMTFSDYQCPYCIRSEPVLAEVLERYPDSVRVIHRHFPLDSIHPFARPAAEAAMCADEQGRFWDYHDAIFARSGRLEEDSFNEIGEKLGLDTNALDSCIDERRYQQFVQDDFLAGQAAGVTGTPAFFVNGIPLKGARDADGLSRVVERELERIQTN